MELRESAILETQRKDKTQANNKVKGKMSPQVDIKKEFICSFCKKNGHKKKEYAKFHKWLENKGTSISFVVMNLIWVFHWIC